MHCKLFGPFPPIKFIQVSVTATTKEKLERPESQNDWNAETIRLLERPESQNHRNAETIRMLERA
jgi:hypothetical protein